MDEDRGRQLRRQWMILRKIAANRRSTVESLAAEFGVCKRTIRRDLATFEEVRFPVQFVDSGYGREQWIRLDKDWLFGGGQQ